MQIVLTPLDIVVFIGSILLVMGIGLWTGRQEKDTEDFFLAGRSVPWYAVAGSIFGTNVSANHLVGMMGIGYSIGFAQSHFELGAIAGLMLLCYGFLPLYKRMRIYTLSEFLGRRYDERSRVLYSLIAMIVITLIQMVAGFYIGSRAMNFMLAGTPLEMGYTNGIIILAVVSGAYTIVGGLKAVIWTDMIQSLLLLAAGILVAILTFAKLGIGFAALMELDASLLPGDQKFHLYLPPDHPELPWTGVLTGLLVLHFFYWSTNQFIVQRALAAKSDFDGQMGIVAAGFFKLLIPFFAIGGGIAAGLLFRSGVENYVVRAQIAPEEYLEKGVVGLSKDGSQEQLPPLPEGFDRPDDVFLQRMPLPDDAFPALVGLVVPAGFGLTGLIAAGLIGAILSSIDSMMNSGATLFTFDFYKRFLRTGAGEKELLLVGRVAIALFIVVSGVLATIFYTESDKENFFLKLASQTGHLVPGVFMAFLVGILWRGATGHGSFVAILVSPFFSVSIEWLYNHFLGTDPDIAAATGTRLNFLHRTAVTAVFACGVLILVSLLTRRTRDPQKEKYTWRAYRQDSADEPPRPFWRSERPWAVLLCALAIWMMIYFV